MLEVNMRVCLMTDSLGTLPFEEMLDTAREAGIKSLEFATGNWSKAPHLSLDALLDNGGEQKKFINAIVSRGLKIEALNCSGNPLAPNETGKAHAEVVEKTFSLARQLGVKKIVMMSGLPGGGPGEKTANWITTSWPPETTKILEWQWNEVAIPWWEKTVQKAGACGITQIALENHGCQLVYNPATLLRLRKAVGNTVGMNLDPSHLFWMGGDGCAAARELGNAVYHVHVKDARIETSLARINGLLDTQTIDRYATRSWNYVAVGFGHDALWWKTFFAALRMTGYNGALSLEMEDMSMSQIAGCKKSMETILASVEVEAESGE
jgi:sugar phosphate isomerase/epimerase